MNLFQIILITALLVLLALYFKYFKNQLAIRLILIGVFSFGIFLAINPGFTIKAANALGVGRGVDLLFYISILFGIIGFIVLYAKYRKLELLLTELIRNEAIRSATNLNEKNNNSL